MCPAHLGDLKPDPRNARKHNPRNVGQIERSLQTNGFGRSILLANDGTIIAGNATVEAAGAVGLEDVILVESDGTKVVAVKRTDVAPGSREALELGIADNRAAELAEWDTAALSALADDIDLGEFFFDDELDALLDAASPTEEESKYSAKVETPLYEPTGETPVVTDLFNSARYDSLVAAIDAADIPAETAAFLRAAATRHIAFDYRRIAEFYANADPVVQALMEDSALVIIDVGRAIELGYAKFRTEMLAIASAAIADGADDGDG